MMIGAMWKQIVARNLSSCAPLLSTNKTLWGRPCATLDRAIHFLYINAKDKILLLKRSFLILFILGNGFSSFGELNPGSAGGCSWKGSCQSCQANHGFFSIFAFHLKFMSTRTLQAQLSTRAHNRAHQWWATEHTARTFLGMGRERALVEDVLSCWGGHWAL